MTPIEAPPLAVVLDGALVATLETARPTSLVIAWTRLPAAENPLLRVPALARAATDWLVNRAEMIKSAGYARLAPVQHLSWARSPPAALTEHLAGRPRVIVAISHTDAEPWTPRLFGRRLLFPTAGQQMRGGNLPESSCLRLQLGTPPPRAIELPHQGHFGLLRSPGGEHLEVAPTHDGYFVASLTMAANAANASVSVTSTTSGRPTHKSWRLSTPAWFEFVVGLDALPGSRPA